MQSQRDDASGRAAGHAALIVVQLCFGLIPIFGKWAFAPDAFSPMSLGAWRMASAAISAGSSCARSWASSPT